jgi:WD40 repeat protein
MLSGSDDGTARMWDLATLKCISSFAARRKEGDDPMPVNSVSMRGRHIYLAAGPFVLEYDTKMPAEHDVETVLSMPHATASTQLGDSDISQMQVSHDGSQLAAVDEDGAVWVMNLSTRAVAMLPEKHDGIGTCLAWRSMISPWNKELVTGGMDMRILVHQSDKKVLLHELRTSDKAGGKGGSTLFNPPFVHAIDVSAEGR